MSISGWMQWEAHVAANPVDGTPEEMRAAFAALAPPPVDGEKTTVGDVPCTLYGLSEQEPIVWLHGGGLVFGSPETHSALATTLARQTGRSVLVPEYRLAPEHPWPAPLEDALKVLHALTRPVDLVGDSAGGFIALHCALICPDLVARLALVSPNTDHAGHSATRELNSDHDIMNDDAQDASLARHSFGDALAEHPDASPLNRDLANLPPVWITAATNEVLLDDALLLIRRLGRAGVPCDVHIYRGLCHLWMLWPDALPQSSQVMRQLSDWMGKETRKIGSDKAALE